MTIFAWHVPDILTQHRCLRLPGWRESRDCKINDCQKRKPLNNLLFIGWVHTCICGSATKFNVSKSVTSIAMSSCH